MVADLLKLSPWQIKVEIFAIAQYVLYANFCLHHICEKFFGSRCGCSNLGLFLCIKLTIFISILDCFDQEVHDSIVNVFSSQVRVSISTQHLHIASLQIENSDIKGTTTEIKDAALFVCGIINLNAKSKSRGSRLINDSHAGQTRDFCRIDSRLPLRIVKLGGHTYDALCYRYIGSVTSALFHFF